MSKDSDPVTECTKSEPFSFHVVTNENPVYISFADGCYYVV